MKYLLVLLSILLSSLQGLAQINVATNGHISLGTLNATNLSNANTFGLSTYGYPGLYMEHNHSNEYTEFFQIDNRFNDPCIAGRENYIIFYRSEKERANTIVVNKLLISSGTIPMGVSTKMNNSLDLIASLKPVSYYWAQSNETFAGKEDNEKVKNYGFITQDVEKVAPGLVETDSTGIKAVEYEGIIPLLVGAVQDIQGKLIHQKSSLQDLKTSRNPLEAAKVFADGTNANIIYSVPENATNAFVLLTTMSDETVMTTEIIGRGTGLLSLNTEPLNAGIYRYTIFVDGKIQETSNISIIKQ